MTSVYIGYDMIVYPMFIFQLNETMTWDKIFNLIKSSCLIEDVQKLVFNKHDFVPTDNYIKELEQLGFHVTIVESSRDLRESKYAYLFSKEDMPWLFT